MEPYSPRVQQFEHPVPLETQRISTAFGTTTPDTRGLNHPTASVHNSYTMGSIFWVWRGSLRGKIFWPMSRLNAYVRDFFEVRYQSRRRPDSATRKSSFCGS